MTWVKVCGLTDHDDVAAAVDAGADAVGFVNVPSSPRYITLARAAQLATGVDTTTVLLTVNLEPAAALAALERTGISGIQPYGVHRREVAVAAVAAGYLALLPVRAVAGLDLTQVPGMPLVDTPSDTKLGGTGRTFDWSLARDLPRPFVVAGGLGPSNIAAVIQQVDPWGVDASSGLEKSPGRKDHSMVADFINKAKMT